MKINYHYFTPHDQPLIDLLNQHKIEIMDYDPTHVFSTDIHFIIADDHPAFEQIISQLPEASRFNSKKVFSEEEEYSAEWVTWIPMTYKVELTRDDETLLRTEEYFNGVVTRARHIHLTGAPFYVTKPIKHSQYSNFFNCYNAYQVFCTDRAKAILEENNEKVAFRPVLHHKTEQPIGDLYHLNILTELPFEAIDMSTITETKVCPVCGLTTYYPADQLTVFKEYLNGLSGLCKTPAIFTRGGPEFSLYLISRDLYRVLREKKCCRGLLCEPVILK